MSKITSAKKDGSVVQAVECQWNNAKLLLSSKFSTPKEVIMR
jgi:hypothetical protein